ncbi:hypothetical protein QWT69_15145 [Sporosarcina oncorhynchi]|uniref:Uncharacterized protein n=1 Tax=Sporosarcina oncorhynchi TaxID=3056444 RepID=A0ABZ0L6H4_9BACL|nr:hypothetical protein [Sporosarcina sp. T2O-4]WOV87176.1 hypothetical protein QWT69_15145 [Sporosarcina sp. T2O-4]
MNGRTLVIGLVLFVIAISAAIYFTMMAEFDKDSPDETTTVIVD